jgi:hypothetical protein
MMVATSIRPAKHRSFSIISRVPVRCDQRRHIRGLLPLPVLHGERAGVRGAETLSTGLSLTPTLTHPKSELRERPSLPHRCDHSHRNAL